MRAQSKDAHDATIAVAGWQSVEIAIVAFLGFSHPSQPKHTPTHLSLKGGKTMQHWIKSYGPGVPATVDPDTHASIPALFAKAVETFGEHAAFTCFGTSLT